MAGRVPSLRLVVTTLAGNSLELEAHPDSLVADVAGRAAKAVSLSWDDPDAAREGTAKSSRWFGTWAYVGYEVYRATGRITASNRFEISDAVGEGMRFRKVHANSTAWSPERAVSSVLSIANAEDPSGVSEGYGAVARGQCWWEDTGAAESHVTLFLADDGHMMRMRCEQPWPQQRLDPWMVARRMSGPKTAILIRGDVPLAGSSTLRQEGVQDGDALTVCVSAGGPFEEDLAHTRQVLRRQRLLKEALARPPPGMPRRGLEQTPFGHRLALRAAKALCGGEKLSGRMILLLRQGLVTSSEELPWQLFREAGAYGRIVWQHSRREDDCWVSETEFVRFWAEQTELSLARYAVHYCFGQRTRESGVVECEVSGNFLGTRDLEEMAVGF